MRLIDADELNFSFVLTDDLSGMLKQSGIDMAKRRVDNAPTVDLQDDDFGAVLNCAVRYAVGRYTYMPSIVIRVITPLIPCLNDKTLWCFDQDLTEARWTCGYGGSDNESEWLKFLDAVRVERQKRGEELYTSWREKRWS